MGTPGENEKYILSLLEKTNPFPEELYDQLINGSNKFTGIRKYIQNIPHLEEKDTADGARCLRIVVEALDSFLMDYCAPASYLQFLGEQFYQWCRRIADTLSVKDWDVILEDLEFVQDDFTVQLVKSLHGEGTTKEQLVRQCRVSEKTVRNSLMQLDRHRSKGKKPLRIGGQPVYVDVSSATDDNADAPDSARYKKCKRYWTENSMHPLIMQCSVYQVMILLDSLCRYQDQAFSDIAVQMAADIWCQLSDYGKERILFLTENQNEELYDFLTDLSDRLKGKQLLTFTTEKELIRQTGSTPEKLVLALKRDGPCNIYIRENGDSSCLENQRIIFHNGNYYAVPFRKNDSLFDDLPDSKRLIPSRIQRIIPL